MINTTMAPVLTFENDFLSPGQFRAVVVRSRIRRFGHDVSIYPVVVRPSPTVVRKPVKHEHFDAASFFQKEHITAGVNRLELSSYADPNPPRIDSQRNQIVASCCYTLHTLGSNRH